MSDVVFVCEPTSIINYNNLTNEGKSFEKAFKADIHQKLKEFESNYNFNLGPWMLVKS